MALAPRPLALFLAAAIGVAGAIGGGSAVGVARATTSAPDSSSEAAFASKIAMERSSRGIGPLRMADDLTAVARRHSEEMAANQQLSDDPNLATEVQGWQTLGGNAGEGPTVDQVHQAFMASPTHRANILDPSFTDLGVGVVWTGSTLWVTEVFRQPTATSAGAAGATPTTTPATSPPQTRLSSPPASTAKAAAPKPPPAPPPPVPAPPPAAPTSTAAPAPPVDSVAALSPAAVPAPGQFALQDRPSANASSSLIALGPASLGLPGAPGRHLPATYLALALVLLAGNLCALGVAGRAAARRRVFGQSLISAVEPVAWR